MTAAEGTSALPHYGQLRRREKVFCRLPRARYLHELSWASGRPRRATRCSTYAHLCRMLTYADVRTYADLCRMLTYADVRMAYV